MKINFTIMSKHIFLKFIVLLFILSIQSCLNNEKDNIKPNDVLIITDDQSNGDLSLTEIQFSNHPVTLFRNE